MIFEAVKIYGDFSLVFSVNVGFALSSFGWMFAPPDVGAKVLPSRRARFSPMAENLPIVWRKHFWRENIPRK